MTTELKVGIVVLFSIVLLFYMSARIGKFGILTQQGYELKANFKNVAGLDNKSPVQVAGVEVGRVKDIKLEEYHAKATLIITPGVKIPVDSKVAIKSAGILGDKYLEIIPGQSTQYLKDRDKIEHVTSYADYDELFGTVSSAAKSFGQTMENINQVLGEKEKQNIRNAFQNIQQAAGEIKGLVADNRDNVKVITTNLATASEQFQPLVKKADTAFSGMSEIVQNVREGKGSLGLLLKDEKLYKDASQTVASLRTISSDLDQGKGSLGMLLKDDSLYLEAKQTVKNIREVTDSINRGEGTLGKLAKDPTLAVEAEKALKKVQKAAEGVQEQTPITILGTIFGILF
jgi:phospholipid/cholesterol/gamma-HCH transport system substrate-binding protein